MRPPFCWNFFEEHEDKYKDTTPHMLRHDALPMKCYIDGRIESLYEDIQYLGHHLTRNEEQRWKTLMTFTLKIFQAEAVRDEQEGEEKK